MSQDFPYGGAGDAGQGQPTPGDTPPISPITPGAAGVPGGEGAPGEVGPVPTPLPGEDRGPPGGDGPDEGSGGDRRRVLAIVAIFGLVVVLLLAGWLFLTGAEETPTAAPPAPETPDTQPTQPAVPDQPTGAPEEPGGSPPLAQPPAPLPPGVFVGARDPFEPLVSDQTDVPGGQPTTPTTPQPAPAPQPTQPTQPGGTGGTGGTAPGTGTGGSTGANAAPALVQMTGQQSLRQGRFRVAMPPTAKRRWYVAKPGETFAKEFTLERLRWDDGKQRVCAVARYSGQTFRICRGDTVRF